MVITPKERQRVACLVRFSDYTLLSKFDGPRSFGQRHTRNVRDKDQIKFKPIGLLLETNYPSGCLESRSMTRWQSPSKPQFRTGRKRRLALKSAANWAGRPLSGAIGYAYFRPIPVIGHLCRKQSLVGGKRVMRHGEISRRLNFA